MQTNYNYFAKISDKMPNSSTAFLDNQKSYVVAFALKETYDDLVTAQQMICNKRSPQESNSSITISNPLKLLESGHTVVLDETSSLLQNSALEENTASKEIIITNKKKPDILVLGSNILEVLEDDNKIIPFIETDGTTDSSNDEKQNEIEKTGRTEKSYQPEVIFNATNYTQRVKDNKFVKEKKFIKENKFFKRKTKIHKMITPKCNKVICRARKNNKRLDKTYYDKIKRNSVASRCFREGFSDISTVISRSRVLKHGLAKENLLNETESTSIPNDLVPFNENDDVSQVSYTSTATNGSFISNLSGKTLIQESSGSSLNDKDMLSVVGVRSTFEMSPGALNTYKNEVINVAVAVNYNQSKIDTVSSVIPNNVKIMHLENLTSQASSEYVHLTSENSSNFENLNKTLLENKIGESEDAKDISSVTLVNKMSSFDASSYETFAMARTSSDFNESSASTFTLKMDKVIKTVLGNGVKETKQNENTNDKQSILQTVNYLGYYPEYSQDSPSTSSAGTVSGEHRDVFVTGTTKNYRMCAKNMGDHRNGNKDTKILNKNILKKQFHEQNTAQLNQKAVNLLNHNRIEEMLTNHGMKNLKYIDESQQFLNIAEMWDKLIVVLDVSFKRLETTITEKIIKELKNSIAALERYVQFKPEVNMDLEKGDIIVIEPPVRKDISDELKEYDGSVQCNLVKSEAIDEIVSKLTTQRPKIIGGRRVKSLQLMKSRLFRDYFEVLKPSACPEVFSDKEEGDTIYTARTEDFGLPYRLKMLFFGPFGFIRENLFIISSVPAFFVVLTFVYGIFMLLVHLW